MAKKSITALEGALRDNVRRLLKLRFDGKPYRLSKAHPRVVLSRIQDIIDSGGCNVATLGPLADAFGLKPYQLLIPDLNVKNPQVAVTAKQARALRLAKEEGDDETEGEGEKGG